MLRRSTSFETSPMPMKIAMNRPNTPMAASPRSLMILTSCPAVSCPRRNDEAISITAKSTRLYGTRSRTDSRNTLSATQLAARTGTIAWMLRARTVAGFRHAANEEVFQRIAQRVQRDERRARRDQVCKQPLRWRIERELQRVSSGRDLDSPAGGRCNSPEHLRPEIGYHQLPSVDFEGEDFGEPA